MYSLSTWADKSSPRALTCHLVKRQLKLFRVMLVHKYVGIYDTTTCVKWTWCAFGLRPLLWTFYVVCVPLEKVFWNNCFILSGLRTSQCKTVSNHNIRVKWIKRVFTQYYLYWVIWAFSFFLWTRADSVLGLRLHSPPLFRINTYPYLPLSIPP